jgi:hypothetical protein
MKESIKSPGLPSASWGQSELSSHVGPSMHGHPGESAMTGEITTNIMTRKDNMFEGLGSTCLFSVSGTSIGVRRERLEI